MLDQRTMKSRALGCATLLLWGLIGCGKVPTWNEMTSGSPAPQNQPGSPQQSVAPVQPAAEVPIVAPPDPAAVISWFKGLQPEEIDDKAITRLTSISSGLDTMTEFNARGGGLTDAGAAELGKLTALEKLNLDGNPITDEGLQAVATLPALHTLSLNSTRISADGIGRLASLPNLKRIELMGVQLTQADFEAIGKLPTLEVLVLNKVLELNDAGLDKICNASTLKALHINECIGLTDKGLSALAKLPNLEELNLKKSNITGIGFTKAGVKSLKILAVSAAPITLPGAKAISGVKSLEALHMDYILNMNDAFFVEFVEGLNHLKYLNIQGSKGIMGGGFSKMKANAGSLETINAMDTGVMDAGLMFLKAHKKLKFIDLTNTSVSQTGVHQFKKFVPACELLYAGVRY